ncbi:MAG TPA: glycosyltransferase, partial [Flavobacterium sp.]|nr:glycosyltransferase [Flavobacterium sp.]
MAKISIITINYNESEGLKKTIESVISQTFRDYEFIVIDGNSSDGSKDVIAQYNDKITYALSEPDSGIYNAMNKGIRAAKGDYVFFLNSGDRFLETHTLEKSDQLIDGKYDICYGNQTYYNQKKKRHESWAFPEVLTL